MSENVRKLKNKIRVAQPLIKLDNISLNRLGRKMRDSEKSLQQAVNHHDGILERKNHLLDNMHESLKAENQINPMYMDNYRRYLNQLEEDLANAQKEVASKHEALESIRVKITEVQLGIHSLRKFCTVNTEKLQAELEKQELAKAEELWLQKSAMGEYHD